MKQLQNVLESTLEHFRRGEVPAGAVSLQDGLTSLRRVMSSDEWMAACKECVSHPLADYLYQDPFTRWAFEKPLGYPGDAILMDFIYGDRSIHQRIESASALGKVIYSYAHDTNACRAVRFRLRTVVSLIDEFAAGVPGGAEILSIASGHVREAHQTPAISSGRTRRFVAVDQDERTIGRVAEELGCFGVEAITATARTIITGRFQLGYFDFIYSSGLSDYLADSVVSRLILRLFSMLKPGGVLLMPNFVPDNFDAAYMEAFMDWHLIYRTETDLLKLTEGIDPAGVAGSSVFFDPGRSIAFLRLQKVA